jgi:hypothetical protein
MIEGCHADIIWNVTPRPLLTGTEPAGNGRAHRAYYQGDRVVAEPLTGRSLFDRNLTPSEPVVVTV